MSEAARLPLVLAVDDKANMLTLIAKILKTDARVLKATSGAAAIQMLGEQAIDAVICDLRMPDVDGLAVLDAARRLRPHAPFLLMTAYGTVPTAIDAMKRGAFDYLTKPFEPEQLRQMLLHSLARNAASAADPATSEPLPGIIGGSLAMAELSRVVRRVAASDTTALVLGETGAGKELVARALHSLGPRAGGMFISVSCVSANSDAIDALLLGPERPRGAVPMLAGDTVFLDEVGELRLAAQAKLTHALEQRGARTDSRGDGRGAAARFIAATHRDLDAMAREGSFREDLLYRLRLASIHIPPLRERGGDIATLAAHFLAEDAARRHRASPLVLSAEAALMLERYRWPGNVRELKAAVERAAIVVEGERIEVNDLPVEVRAGSSTGPLDLASMSYQQALEASREDATRRYLEAVLRRTNGKVVLAAEIAGVERESFYRLLRRYGVSADDFRGD